MLLMRRFRVPREVDTLRGDNLYHGNNGRVDLWLRHWNFRGSYPFLKLFFPSVYRKEALDTSTNQYCKFDSQLLTLFTSSLYVAALIASFVASFVNKKHGRKVTMFLGGLFFLLGALLNAAAVHISMLILGRILLGVGVGFANQSEPIYLSEIAPYKYRGTFNVLFQLAITIGILIANIVNFLTNKISAGWGWRWCSCASISYFDFVLVSRR